jgi:hydrogenase expression/formation protein HypC
MCLAVPALVKKIEDTMAEVELGGITTRASILFTPEVTVGDYINLHAGYAISIVDAEEAEETLRLLAQMADNDVEK